jgi:hypothetical protein
MDTNQLPPSPQQWDKVVIRIDLLYSIIYFKWKASERLIHIYIYICRENGVKYHNVNFVEYPRHQPERDRGVVITTASE